MVTFPSTYFFFFFFCSAYILIDLGFHYLGIELNALYDRRMERYHIEEKLKALKDNTQIRRKVTFYKSKSSFILYPYHTNYVTVLFRHWICILATKRIRSTGDLDTD